MIWYFQNAERFRTERLVLEALAAEVDWLQPLEWRIDNALRIIWDADIVIGEKVFPVSLRYPNHFPHSPPLVLPRGDKALWSSHQWGVGGELCLEYGADNWQQEIAGADMVRSAHRLLEMEEALPAARHRIPSRHQMSQGQDLRGTYSRFLVTPSFEAFVKDCRHDVLEGYVDLLYHEDAAVYYASHFSYADNEIWRNLSTPAPLRAESRNLASLLLKWPADVSLPNVSSADEFRADLRAHGTPVNEDKSLVVVIAGGSVHAYRLIADSVWKIEVINAEEPQRRLIDAYASLADRRVAIIGCGSLGSKVAASLARSGVGDFFLVDDDILMPGNFVRHDLDWRDVGTHKVDSVARRIQMANPKAKCEVRRHRLGGQESSGSLETLIETIAKCDLIIDASASPEVFNYLCASVALGTKPMIWAEVHGGGIGGCIARYRPGIEPEPAMMRRLIENWCAEKGIPAERAERSYEDRANGVPLIADDADVSVIAAHTARFAIDLLLLRSPSMFPHSVYFIGLAEGWFYSQPFHTEPVDVAIPPPTATASSLDEAEAASERALVIEMIGRAFSGADNIE